MGEIGLAFHLVVVVVLPRLDDPLDHLFVLFLEGCLVLVVEVGDALGSGGC